MSNPFKLMWNKFIDTMMIPDDSDIEIEQYVLSDKQTTTYDEISKHLKKEKYYIERENKEDCIIWLNEVVDDAVFRIFVKYYAKRNGIYIKVIYPDEFTVEQLERLPVVLCDINESVLFGSFKAYSLGCVSFDYEYVLDRGHFNPHVLDSHIKRSLDLCSRWYEHIMESVNN